MARESVLDARRGDPHRYLPYIRRDVDVHYTGMAHRRKENRTRNPNYPAGSYRPIERLLGSEDYSMAVTEDQVDEMEDTITDYYNAEEEEPASAWEVDPLETDALRAERDRMVAAARPLSAASTYVAFRDATLILLEEAQ